MEKEKRFKVGDKVTYLSHAESVSLKLRDDHLEAYRYGGEDRGGIIGQVLTYHEYNEKAKCSNIVIYCFHIYLFTNRSCHFRCTRKPN